MLRQSTLNEAGIATRDVLWLFNDDWDRRSFDRFHDRFRFHYAGFDLFSFPSNVQLAWFDLDRFADRLARRFRSRGLAGVVSNHEQFGALAAALVAERLGLPGTPPAAIVACQHKHVCRQILDRVAPEANLRHFVLPTVLGDRPTVDLDYPLFLKPIKAAFSVLARRIGSPAELDSHLRFGRRERWIIDRLVAPFDAVARRLAPDSTDARRMIIEEPIDAPQFNLDGYVFNGRTHALGVVDEIMYPGTQAFLRFVYPSRLPADVQRRAVELARVFLEAIGFTHGMFNMEFFHDPRTGSIRIIEFNARLSAQMADLYQRVDGLDVFGMTLALACGEDPAGVARLAPLGGAAASLVYRTFDEHTPPPLPDESAQRWLATEFPEHRLHDFRKLGNGLRRELKWLGSHRYAVLHLHGDDENDLRERHARVSRRLGWPVVW